MTYPWGRTLVWHHALVSVEHGEGFVRLCERAAMHEKCRAVLFPSVVPAWLALTLVAFAGAHTEKARKKWPWWRQNVVMAEANGRCAKFFFQKL